MAHASGVTGDGPIVGGDAVTPDVPHHHVASGVLVACGGGDSDDTDATIEPTTPDRPVTAGAQAGYTIVQRFPRRSRWQAPCGCRSACPPATPSSCRMVPPLWRRRCGTSTASPSASGSRRASGRRPRPLLRLPPHHRDARLYPGRRRRPSGGATFDVAEPGSVTVPSPGDPLPPFDTPTTDDAGGVDPICTLEPEHCPFHDAR